MQPRFELKSLLDDLQVHVKIVSGIAVKSLERVLGLVDLALPYQDPRRLGAEGQEGEDEDGEAPLDRDGDLIGRTTCSVAAGLND